MIMPHTHLHKIMWERWIKTVHINCPTVVLWLIVWNKPTQKKTHEKKEKKDITEKGNSLNFMIVYWVSFVNVMANDWHFIFESVMVRNKTREKKMREGCPSISRQLQRHECILCGKPQTDAPHERYKWPHRSVSSPLVTLYPYKFLHYNDDGEVQRSFNCLTLCHMRPSGVRNNNQIVVPIINTIK